MAQATRGNTSKQSAPSGNAAPSSNQPSAPAPSRPPSANQKPPTRPPPRASMQTRNKNAPSKNTRGSRHPLNKNQSNTRSNTSGAILSNEFESISPPGGGKSSADGGTRPSYVSSAVAQVSNLFSWGRR
mmetsp:Transcript_9464/g.10971  ORF Transcript_9464/g.10971 Transcript_9464/m.10971 type:complete len:129 (-) Transcript_9464:156-542(-)